VIWIMIVSISVVGLAWVKIRRRRKAGQFSTGQ